MVLTINVAVGLDDVSPNVSSSVAGGETGVWQSCGFFRIQKFTPKVRDSLQIQRYKT